MTDEEKQKAALAAKDQEIADLKAQLAKPGDPAADEDLTPTPTQAELDAIKLGERLDAGKSGSYKNRQLKAD